MKKWSVKPAREPFKYCIVDSDGHIITHLSNIMASDLRAITSVPLLVNLLKKVYSEYYNQRNELAIKIIELLESIGEKVE